MEAYVLPVSSRPNQTFKTTIPAGQDNIDLTITLNYREAIGYWTMTITDKAGKDLLANMPLLSDSNLLAQFDYLGLGFLTPLDVNNAGTDYPGATQLGILGRSGKTTSG